MIHTETNNDAVNHMLAMGYSLDEINDALKRVRDNEWTYEELLCLPPRKESSPVVVGYDKPSDFSDTANAEIFEQLFYPVAMWTRGGGWFVWSGVYWEQSDQKAVMLARSLSDKMLNNALAEHLEAVRKGSDDALKEAKGYLSHAQATRRKNRLDAMLGLAQAGLIKDYGMLDPNPFDLNTPAGIVDLTTGAIRPHDPAAFCSKVTKYAPSDTGGKMWWEFLDLIAEGDALKADFLQQVAGMSLIGKVFHEGIIIAHGGGRNGKSTFFNAIANTMGSYAGHIAVNTLTTERTNKGATLATLRGKRLVLTGELEEHQRLSVAMLKALASTDTLVAEEKFRAPEEFKQSHTICLFTNHLPRVGSTDGGTWRRLIVVPFDAVISTKNAIQNYGEVLSEKAGPAILQWAIEGAVNFVRQRYKLIIPDCVAIATEEYQAREDWVSNFIAECCIKGDRVAGGELYAAYRAWAERSGEYARRSNDFVAAMESAGYKKITSNGRAYWIGLNLDDAQTVVPQRYYLSSRA